MKNTNRMDLNKLLCVIRGIENNDIKVDREQLIDILHGLEEIDEENKLNLGIGNWPFPFGEDTETAANHAINMLLHNYFEIMAEDENGKLYIKHKDLASAWIYNVENKEDVINATSNYIKKNKEKYLK